MRRILVMACTIAVVLSAAGALVAKEITVQGRLQKTVESGGWLIAAGKSRYLILNARDFQKETWFKESAEVEAVGVTKPDVVTTYMEGTPFEARTMHPVEQTGASVDTGASVTVTMSDLAKVGTVIDATAQAGANDVAGISFTLRQDRPARDQALKEATREAVSKAQVIAQALGGRVVRIVEVQEEGFERPRPIYEANAGLMRASAQVATPIEVGSLDITSRVQLIAEVETNL